MSQTPVREARPTATAVRTAAGPARSEESRQSRESSRATERQKVGLCELLLLLLVLLLA